MTATALAAVLAGTFSVVALEPPALTSPGSSGGVCGGFARHNAPSDITVTIAVRNRSSHPVDVLGARVDAAKGHTVRFHIDPEGHVAPNGFGALADFEHRGHVVDIADATIPGHTTSTILATVTFRQGDALVPLSDVAVDYRGRLGTVRTVDIPAGVTVSAPGHGAACVAEG